MIKHSKSIAVVVAVLILFSSFGMVSASAADEELIHKREVEDYIRNWSAACNETTASIDLDRIPAEKLEEYYSAGLDDLDEILSKDLEKALQEASFEKMSPVMAVSPLSFGTRASNSDTYTASRDVTFTWGNATYVRELVWIMTLYRTVSGGSITSLNGSSIAFETATMTYSNVQRTTYVNYVSYAIVGYSAKFSTVVAYYTLDKTETFAHSFYP